MKKLIILIACWTCLLGCTTPKTEEGTGKSAATPPPVEFSEASFVEAAQKNLKDLAEGNITAFSDGIADNAKFRWNNGDSLVGKKAILDYWTDRRGRAIDTITYTREAWLGIKANETPAHIPKGVYVFNWADFQITYANGKTLNMNIHHVYSFDDAGKIDEFIQYVDRAPILAATKNK